MGTERRFVSQLQLDSVTRAGRFPRQERRFGERILVSAVVGRVGAELWGAPAAPAGWLVCVEVMVSVSVFRVALAYLLLWSDEDGFLGAAVA